MHGHVSVRDGDVAYINSHSASRLAIRPEEVAVVRIADAARLEGTPPSELPIHLATYRARSDAGAVVHFHGLHATALAVTGKPLVAASNAGAPFGKEVPVFDDPRLVRDDAIAARLVSVLGSGRAALMRGHGAVVVGDDVPAATALAIELEESARRLWLAYAIGEPRRYSDAEITDVARELTSPAIVRKIWIDALARARHAGVLDDLDTAGLA
jgi:HCOMODA/2-hydroxy-3-carboxy-muconic semialdehyde decarboxylase